LYGSNHVGNVHSQTDEGPAHRAKKDTCRTRAATPAFVISQKRRRHGERGTRAKLFESGVRKGSKCLDLVGAGRTKFEPKKKGSGKTISVQKEGRSSNR